MRADWLAVVLRAAGLRVAEQPGWPTRGREMTAVQGVVCHHTAGPAAGNAPSLNIVTYGRSDLAGPLSQLVLGRDGTFYVVASGRANHAGAGNWNGVTDGNGRFLGIEAEATGTASWPAVQVDAYARGVAAILRRIGRDSSWACGHKEFALPRGRKPDPNFDMSAFRRRVAGVMAKPVAAVLPLAPSGPAVAARGDLLTVLTRADDGALRARAADGAGWDDLGGTVTSEPAAVSWGGNRLDVFARGADGALWHRWADGATWAGWESLAGQVTSSPAVASWGPDRLDVFCRGDGAGLWHRPWTGEQWGAWASLGGQLGSAPAAVSWGPNRVDVFTRGADSALWHVWWDGKSWSGWQTLGGAITSAPAAVSTAPDRLDVFARGEDRQLWRAAWDGRAWTWDRLGGLLSGAPGAAARSGGRVDVVAVGADGEMWRRSWDGAAWGAWAEAWPAAG